MNLRLDKYLSDLGIASRKELKQIIRSGRVEIDGTVVTLPEAKLDPETSVVSFDGQQLNYARYRYFMMDKPTGVLTAATDKKQQTVLDLLPPEYKRLDLFPVGRLDKDTSGLLLLTNDGDFSHRVISPKSEIKKVYEAYTETPVTNADVEAFQNGLILRDGLHCLPAVLQPMEENRCLVTVMEGKYHQVRRMLASVGKPVVSLRRLSIGKLALPETLNSGGVVELSQKEIDQIFLEK